MWNVAALLLCAFITTANTLESTSSLLESKVMYRPEPTGGGDSSWFKYAEYKWTLSLRHKVKEQYLHYCFAIWIAPRFGMTAINCVDQSHRQKVCDDEEALKEIYVTPRSSSIDVSDDEVYKVVTYTPVYVFIRSLNLNPWCMDGSDSISFVKFDKNIDLPTSSLKSTIFEEEMCSDTLIGWNSLQQDRPHRHMLVEVEIEVLEKYPNVLFQTGMDRFLVKPMIEWQEFTRLDLGALVFMKDKGPGILVSYGFEDNYAIILHPYKGYIDRFINSLEEGHFLSYEWCPWKEGV